MDPLRFWVKFKKGDQVIQRSVMALNKHQVCEILGIDSHQLIECKVIDGI
jgi:hypothetical protein